LLISAKRITNFYLLIGLCLSTLVQANPLGNPLANSELKDPQTIEKLALSYQSNCSHCHSGNAPSAPQIRDAKEWAKRLSAGFNHLYDSAINGIPNTAMLAKGGHTQLSNDEVQNLVHYLLWMAKIDSKVIQAALKYDALKITDAEFICIDQKRLGYLEKENFDKANPYFDQFEKYDTLHDGKMNEQAFLKMRTDLQKYQRETKLGDEELQKNILKNLSLVKGMPAAGIRVGVQNGHVAIQGVVGDSEVLGRAFSAVRWLPGIQKLDNRLMTAEMMAFD